MVEDRRNEGVYMVAGFVLGSLTLAVIVYFLVKSFALLRSGQQSQQLQGGGSGTPINIYNVTGNGGQIPQTFSELPSVRQLALNDGISLGTKMDTVMLNPSRSTRVFSVPRKGPMWRVRISVIGPAGGYGLFAIDSPVDGGPNSNLTVGSPQGIVVAAGDHTEIKLGPRQIIYGRAAGTEDDVQVSVSASAEA